MRILIAFILSLTLLAGAQAQNEKVFRVAKSVISFNPKFDTLARGNDTLQSSRTYRYELIGIDSASIADIQFRSGIVTLKNMGDDEKTGLTILPVYSSNEGDKSMPLLKSQLMVFRKNDDGTADVCLTHTFFIRPDVVFMDGR